MDSSNTIPEFRTKKEIQALIVSARKEYLFVYLNELFEPVSSENIYGQQIKLKETKYFFRPLTIDWCFYTEASETGWLNYYSLEEVLEDPLVPDDVKEKLIYHINILR